MIDLFSLEMNNKSFDKPLVIIGGAGHGSVIASCIKDNRDRYQDYEWELKGFCNDYDSEVDGYPVLGKLSDIPQLLESGYYFSWGIHLIGRNYKTLELFNGLSIPDERLATIIHHSAFIADSVIVGPGAFIMYNAYIAPRSTIGRCAMIKANTNIGHDVIIGDLAHVAMGSTIVSFAKIGRCSDVAVSSTVLANRIIGDYSMIGASSLCTHDIPDGEIWVGSPAKFLRKMDK